MKSKKIAVIALAAILGTGILTPALAAETAAPSDSEIISEQYKEVGYVRMYGTVEAVNAESIQVTNEQSSLVLTVDENTYLVEGQNGTPLLLTDFQVGDAVSVAYGPEVQESEPGQSSAIAVMRCGDVTPVYTEIEAVTANADGSVRLTTDGGSILVTVAADAVVQPFRTKNILSLADLSAGEKVVLYYDIVALSHPGQAGTDRVVVLDFPEAYNEPAIAPERDETMVPLREALGDADLHIIWNASARTVVLSAEGFEAVAGIGGNIYKIAGSDVEMPAAQLVDGRTYVPQCFIDEVLAAIAK